MRRVLIAALIVVLALGAGALRFASAEERRQAQSSQSNVRVTAFFQ